MVMSFAEIKEELATLSPEQRTELLESLHALEEGVSIEELRAINAALDEEINDPSPGLSLKEVRQNIRALKPGDVP
jgi:DNA-binding transcriptional MerR regulator